MDENIRIHKNEPVTVVQVALGGYGFHYFNALCELQSQGKVRIAGVVDPDAESSDHWDRIVEDRIPFLTSLPRFYDSNKADLAVIVSPFQFHADQSILAMQHDSHVLCEKPVAATVQDVNRMIGTRESSDRWIEIGYQWSYSDSIQRLKADIVQGRFGPPSSGKALYLWPRDRAYYTRNDWAGRVQDNVGNWILDSPVQSAMAHDLHNLFFLLGPTLSQSAKPKLLSAELYRANPIENFDTAAIQIETEAGIHLSIFVSHAVDEKTGPWFEIQFEKATVGLSKTGKLIEARFHNGERVTYGHPDDEPHFKKLESAVNRVHAPRGDICGLEASRSQVLCVNGLQDAVKEIKPLPADVIRPGKQAWNWMEGLDEALIQCYKTETLPYQNGWDWTHPPQNIVLSDHQFFPGGHPPKSGDPL